MPHLHTFSACQNVCQTGFRDASRRTLTLGTWKRPPDVAYMWGTADNRGQNERQKGLGKSVKHDGAGSISWCFWMISWEHLVRESQYVYDFFCTCQTVSRDLSDYLSGKNVLIYIQED